MDKNTEKTIWIILYFSFTLIFLLLLYSSNENRVIIGFLSSLLIISVSIRLSILYPNPSKKYIGKFLIFVDLTVVYLIFAADTSGISILYTIIIIMDSIFFHSYTFSFLIIVLGYLSFIINKISTPSLYTNLGNISLSSVIALLGFVFLSSILYFLKEQIIQRSKLSNSMNEIEEKNIKLEKAYSKLKEHSEALEEMAALKERNRISRELHDTVGHTLTTVLVEIEAGKRLLIKDKPGGLDKITLAQEQVRKGLKDIRSSVTMMKEGKDLIEFIPSLKLILEDTKLHTDVKIQYDISLRKNIPKTYEKIIYNSLLEGITNGIKHGNAKEFIFKLYDSDENIFFYLEDKGLGSEDIILGFGLTNMKESVESVNGEFNLKYFREKGFIIEFILKEDLNL
ncbi:sensor histidine kinase [Clostridium algidicarnis]|uniref:histidine kinase n=2 Tax=Clostridium algidicarnis TaxID=37659 RepID=A0A2S6FVD5_9CLOT|nr:sensor histidine kinase [Clostridium algidicarnis]MBB6631710.1 sensor histidine kinase [Clostridium algidicarnis]MBB6697253.1 sensor histidine kinase [Clostridium algidicarnis]MBU3219991.1 sensor histidine kinase [Clostridium algidicarnis]MCB2287100.1 sensor histidine kinase [Clostridium algidicarnis]PPK46322.1 signal transduction histidine kinase [Clostridium algidicarnis DSM 15099]